MRCRVLERGVVMAAHQCERTSYHRAVHLVKALNFVSCVFYVEKCVYGGGVGGVVCMAPLNTGNV